MIRQRGFTLMEMLVGVSTVMVVGAVATPLATTYVQRYQMTAATERLVFEINRARMQAVGQNRFVRVRVTSGGYIREQSTDGINYTAADVTVTMPSGVGISVTGALGPTFNRNGLATATTYVTVARGSETKVVKTNLVGRVTIQ